MPTQPGKSKPKSAGRQIAWNLDWNLLRTFMVIAQEQSITAAAKRLRLKQPSVSNALKRLEHSLGCRMVERGPRSFELTSQGEALFRECAGIFGSVNRLSSALEQATDEITGTVHLHMASHVTCPLLDEALESFHKQHLAACVSISIGSSIDTIKAVQDKTAALGICLVNERMAELDYKRFYTEHFGFFCGPRHRLFGARGLRLEDLQGEHCVSFHTDQLNDVLRPVAILRSKAGMDRHISGVSSNLEEIRRMVMAGMGIGALPIHVVQRDVQDGLLYRLPPYKHPPAIDIWLVRHPDANINQAERAFTRMLIASMENTPKAQRSFGGEPSVAGTAS